MAHELAIPKPSRSRRFLESLFKVLPRGGALPEVEWKRRHKALLIFLAINAVGLPIYSVATGHYDLMHNIGHGAIVLIFTVLAALPMLSRQARSICVSLGLLSSAALLVHISSGLIEAHFYFFVVILALTLYEDWVPFLVAIAYVLLHHGVMGMIDPKDVFHSPEQWAQPWKWAAIHALFVAAAGVAGVIAWRLNEDVRTDMRATQQKLDVAASTDSLTGLANRRKLMDDLDSALSTASHTEPALLVLFDLNGFKTYNDNYGHPAGDSLLARVGGSLKEYAADWAEAYRLGGDEFCLLVPAASRPPEEIELESARALSEHGEGFSITSSSGSVLIPALASSAKEALGIADRRMYAAKQGGRHSAGTQSKHVLLQAMSERYPDLGDHLNGVAELADGLAAELELSEESQGQIRHAAELHDIGKVAIPDAILSKPGRLNDDEMNFIKRHTLIGERIIGAAQSLTPVATLVRSSHERWDGNGYPDQLAGEDIPLGARVIAVCDSFDAMISTRPYSSARSVDEAIAELRRCSGTQFDPAVVEAFCALMTKRAESPVPSTAPLTPA